MPRTSTAAGDGFEPVPDDRVDNTRRCRFRHARKSDTIGGDRDWRSVTNLNGRVVRTSSGSWYQ